MAETSVIRLYVNQ